MHAVDIESMGDRACARTTRQKCDSIRYPSPSTPDSRKTSMSYNP